MIVAGFGFRQSATVDSLRDAYERAGGEAALIATISDKAEAQAFQSLALQLDLPVASIDPDLLQAQDTNSQSHASQSARGTGSVSEAAALAAAGTGARLLAPRAISADKQATCALATKGTP